jgi:hypothetical protein
MTELRETFLECSRGTLSLIEAPPVAASWDRPSALAHMTVGALAGHLYRATGSVAEYLDRDEPEEETVSPTAYYIAALHDPEQHGSSINLASRLHTGIRRRSTEAAEEGHSGLVARLRHVLSGLERRLPSEPPTRKVKAFRDLVLTLDDYLVTRIVEMAVHADDLATSVRLALVDFPNPAYDLAIDLLVDMARERHGDIAVLRALTRRERDEADALRVI